MSQQTRMTTAAVGADANSSHGWSSGRLWIRNFSWQLGRERFEKLLNPTYTSSVEESKFEDLGEAPLIPLPQLL